MAQAGGERQAGGQGLMGMDVRRDRAQPGSADGRTAECARSFFERTAGWTYTSTEAADRVSVWDDRHACVRGVPTEFRTSVPASILTGTLPGEEGGAGLVLYGWSFWLLFLFFMGPEFYGGEQRGRWASDARLRVVWVSFLCRMAVFGTVLVCTLCYFVYKCKQVLVFQAVRTYFGGFGALIGCWGAFERVW